MGSHRADHPAPGRRKADPTPGRGDLAATPYVGRRVAGREAPATPQAPIARQAESPAPLAAPAAPPMVTALPDVLASAAATPSVVPAPLAPAVALRTPDRAPTVELPALRDIPLFDPLTDSSTTALRAVEAAGKRRAVRHAGPRGPLFRGLPSLPVAVGVATLAVAVGGAVVSAEPELASGGTRLAAANAMTGAFGSGAIGGRTSTLSRDSDRETLEKASGNDLVAEAERHAEERNSALGQLAQAAEKEAAEIALNRWVTPLANYRLTARYGEYGLWSSYHTGLDFAAPTGTPIRAVTNGTVSSAGYDGAYGNKTVLTLDDGTELWFCHQSRIVVKPGEKVRTGELIGYVGSTGNVTGPHLHLEVRPGGGDPVDPDAALRQHGVTP